MKKSSITGLAAIFVVGIAVSWRSISSSSAMLSQVAHNSSGSTFMDEQLVAELVQRSNQQSPSTIQDSQNQATNATPSIKGSLGSWPPLESVITGKWNITGDPQFVLDFAIIGHAKCGTSTMMLWLGNHVEIFIPQVELRHLTHNQPASMIRQFYQPLPRGGPPASHFAKRGYKAPSDIEKPHVLQIFRKYWPKTGLVVGVRHPVRWFESLYNFRVQNYNSMPDALTLIGSCSKGTKNTCTNKGTFHLNLARLRKTVNPNTTKTEAIRLLKKQEGLHKTRYWKNLGNLPDDPTPNPVFFYEVSQLSDKNESRATQFRSDLQSFLGLKEPFPPVFHEKPGKKVEDEAVQEEKNSRKIDICDQRYEPLREALMEIAQDSSIWIRKYFLKSAGVFVSSPSYLVEMLELWMKDPCN